MNAIRFEGRIGAAGVISIVCLAVFLVLLVVGLSWTARAPETLEELERFKAKTWVRTVAMMLTAGVGLVALIVARAQRRMPRVLGVGLAIFYFAWWALVGASFVARLLGSRDWKPIELTTAPSPAPPGGAPRA